MLLQTIAEYKLRIIQDRMRQASQAWRGGKNLKNRLPLFANVQHVTEAKLQELKPISHPSCVGCIKTIYSGAKGTQPKLPMTSTQEPLVTNAA
jgi:hypothetical protein